MFLASLDWWHPIRLCFYGFVAAVLLGALYCVAPFGGDPHLRIFRGLLAMHAAFLCFIAIFIPSLRKQEEAAYGHLISRTARIRGFDGRKALSFERTWFAVTAFFAGLSFLVPLYALSKAVLSWVRAWLERCGRLHIRHAGWAGCPVRLSFPAAEAVRQQVNVLREAVFVRNGWKNWPIESSESPS